MLPVRTRVQWIIDDSIPNTINCNVAVVAALVQCLAMYGRFLFTNSESPKSRAMDRNDRNGTREEKQSSRSDEQEFISVVIMYEKAKSIPADQKEVGGDDEETPFTHQTGFGADFALGELKMSVEVNKRLVTCPCETEKGDGTAHVHSGASPASL
jgi:hypothetical protein